MVIESIFDIWVGNSYDRSFPGKRPDLLGLTNQMNAFSRFRLFLKSLMNSLLLVEFSRRLNAKGTKRLKPIGILVKMPGNFSGIYLSTIL